jgi:hypothetical protein
MKIKSIISLIIIIILIFFFIIILNIREILSTKQKDWLKENILPWQQLKIKDENFNQYKAKLYKFLLEKELSFQNKLYDFEAIASENILKLDNNLELKKYILQDGFFTGIGIIWPGSGYLDFYNDNLFIISARGILGYGKIKDDQINFKQIKHNLYNFMDYSQFSKGNSYSVKDIHILNDKIYISYLEEVKSNCWNISLLSGNLDYENIIFEKIHSDDNCIHAINNKEKEFNPNQSGGRIISANKNEIYFSTGEFRSRYLAQDKDSFNGKILRINSINGAKEIISMGHRNPQGLYYDLEHKFIVETEHGPFGGDEINIIPLESQELPNFGWPIASYGEHYSKKTGTKDKFKKYPLLKSHKDNNFREPAKYFVPSIGISEIVGIKNNTYILSTLRENSIYLLRLSEFNKFEIIKKYSLGERVRDMIFKNDKLILYLENSASIGIIDMADFKKNT